MGSSRIACLYVPALPLQSLLRAEPELYGGAVAVTQEAGPRGVVLCATPAAIGVWPGMTAVQAQSACPGLVVRAIAPALIRSAEDALHDLALAFSPLVERRGGGVLLEIGDLGPLFPSERELGAALLAQSGKLGLDAQLAIAAHAATARVLARSRAGATIVPPGEDRAYLAPLPLLALLPDLGQVEVLNRWGIRTAGELAALPRAQLASRLGPAGVALHRLACAEDTRPLSPTAPEETLSEVLDLDESLDNLEPLSFVLRGLLDRLVARLALRSLACGKYTLRLTLESRGHDERAIAIASPTREVATLLQLARISLAAQPPPAPVRKIAVLTTPAPLRPTQLSLLAPAGPSPERLSTTLARLHVLCGEGRVGAPAVLDSYLPGQVHLVAFPEAYPPPPDAPPPHPGAGLTTHILRPPQAAETSLREGTPVFVRADAIAGRVVTIGGPYRVRVGFGSPVLRDYYDIELETGALYRLFQDLSTNRWFLDARYH